MRRLHGLLVPALLGTCLSLTGCTGVNPINWSSIAMPRYEYHGRCRTCQAPMVAKAKKIAPGMQPSSQNLVLRGVLREHWNLARNFEEAGDTGQAIAHYEKILSLQPDYAPAHQRLGVLATMQGRFNDADEHFHLARSGTKLRPVMQEPKAPVNSSVDAYYAQDETPASLPLVMPVEGGVQNPSARGVQNPRIAAQTREGETISSTVASKYSTMQPADPAESQEYKEAARIHPRPSADDYYAQTDEEDAEPGQAVEETSEIEPRTASHSMRSNSARRDTPRPTISSVPVSKREVPADRSVENRENSLRSSQEEIPAELSESAQVAEESARLKSPARLAEAKAAATSGIRRTSTQEPEAIETEERVFSETIQRLSAVRERERAARAELIEAEIEARASHELEISLAERRLKLAREQLRLAQQQLIAAVEAAGEEPRGHENAEAAGAIEPAKEAVPRTSRESRLPLPAPRRLKTEQTTSGEETPDAEPTSSAEPTLDVEPEGQDFLAGITGGPEVESREEKSDFGWLDANAIRQARPLSARKDTFLNAVDANMPATAAASRATVASGAADEARGAIHLTSGEEEAEPAKFADAISSDWLERSPAEGAENAAVRARHNTSRAQKLPATSANPKEQPIRALDEQTLHRRAIISRNTYTKKSSATPPTLMYR